MKLIEFVCASSALERAAMFSISLEYLRYTNQDSTEMFQQFISNGKEKRKRPKIKPCTCSKTISTSLVSKLKRIHFTKQ